MMYSTFLISLYLHVQTLIHLYISLPPSHRALQTVDDDRENILALLNFIQEAGQSRASDGGGRQQGLYDI